MITVPMLGASKIEIRLRSILNPKQTRFPVTKQLLAVISVIAFGVVVPLAAAKEPAKTRLELSSSQATFSPVAQPDAPSPTDPKAPETRVVTGFKFNGNTVLTADDLQKSLVSKTGVALNRQSVAADLATIQKAYSDKGFAVVVQSAMQDDAGVVSYSLLEAKLTQIKLSGLTKTDPQLIRKLITTPVNELFDATKLRRDLSRIYDTKLFKDVSFKVDDDPEVQGGVIATIMLTEEDTNL